MLQVQGLWIQSDKWVKLSELAVSHENKLMTGRGEENYFIYAHFYLFSTFSLSH